MAIDLPSVIRVHRTSSNIYTLYCFYVGSLTVAHVPIQKYRRLLLLFCS